MKPDWKDAPEWATYFAMDADGTWFWYERKPARFDIAWLPRGDFRFDTAGHSPGWKQSLEQRPTDSGGE
jgi:hypothetical protein